MGLILDTTKHWMIDFDSTLFALHHGQMRSLWQTHRAVANYADVTCWDYWDKTWPEDIVRFVWGGEVFANREWTLRTPPFAGAIESLIALHDAGVEATIVSDRKPHMRQWLQDWLQHWGAPPIPVLVSGNDGMTKIDVVRELGMTVTVDDAPHHNEVFARESGVSAYLVDRPWNRAATPVGCSRVTSIQHAIWIELGIDVDYFVGSIAA